MLIVDIIVSGLILGGVYALFSMGLTLQYGAARIMNLAYGEILVASAFAAYLLLTGMAINPLIGLGIVVPAGFVASWLIYQVLLLPLVRRAPNRGALEVDSILATFGLLFVIQGAAYMIFGGQYHSYSFLSAPVTIAGSIVPLNRLIAFGVAAALGIGLYLTLTRTRTGTAIRAVAVDPSSAPLVGIDERRISGLAFAIGGALCASGGVLVSMFMTFNAAIGVVFTMKALIVIIMGGVGDVLGALLAGLLMGIIETLVARLVDPGLTLAATFALFLAVLLVRPTGIFGRIAR